MTGRVIFQISMSLDGYIRGPNPTKDEPLGLGGMQLHAWAFDEATPPDSKILAEEGMAGAFICGRRTFDDSLPWWNGDGPSGKMRVPTVVVSHSVPGKLPQASVYQFANGIEPALKMARTIANGQDIRVMGGAEIGQEYLAGGLIDEISLHVAPVLFGAGTRLFDNLGAKQMKLELIECVKTPAANHVRYRMAR